MHRLSALLPGIKVNSTDKFGVSGDDMEALAFAWLAPDVHRPLINKEIKMMRNPMMILAVTLAASAYNHPYPGGQSAQTETLHYQCGTLLLTVTLDNVHERVNFILDGQQLSLPQVATASGASYSDGQYSFWSKGKRAFIERQHKIIVDDCVIQSAAGK